MTDAGGGSDGDATGTTKSQSPPVYPATPIVTVASPTSPGEGYSHVEVVDGPSGKVIDSYDVPTNASGGITIDFGPRRCSESTSFAEALWYTAKMVALMASAVATGGATAPAALYSGLCSMPRPCGEDGWTDWICSPEGKQAFKEWNDANAEPTTEEPATEGEFSA